MNILITGGVSGVGRAITEQIAPIESHRLLITYNSSETEAQFLTSRYSNVEVIKCDFNNSGEVDNFCSHLKVFKPEVLINNASGMLKQLHFHKTEPEQFHTAFNRDILPVIKITQAAIEVFRINKFGKIINIISSAIINKPPVGWSIYAANKAYLLALHKSWATEYIKYNITSNAISPSMMKTNLISAIDERMIEMMEQKHPLKNFVEPEEVAKAVEYLINSGQHVNGAHIIINSGEELGV